MRDECTDLSEDTSGTTLIQGFTSCKVVEEIHVFRRPIGNNDEFVIILEPVNQTNNVAVLFQML